MQFWHYQSSLVKDFSLFRKYVYILNCFELWIHLYFENIFIFWTLNVAMCLYCIVLFQSVVQICIELLLPNHYGSYVATIKVPYY